MFASHLPTWCWLCLHLMRFPGNPLTFMTHIVFLFTWERGGRQHLNAGSDSINRSGEATSSQQHLVPHLNQTL